MDDNFELIRSNKGGMKLIHRGYMYTVHKKRQSGGIRWRCTQRSLHCKGSVSTGSGAPRVNMPHNHIPDPHSVALARCRQFEELAEATPLLETECHDPEEPAQAQENATKSQEIASRESPRKIKVNVVANAEPEPEIEEVCLRWNSHHSNMKNTFPALLQREQYVDVTLTSEGKNLKCHRLILSSCSAYFDDLLSSIMPSQHPVLFLNSVPFWILKSLIDFMYSGEVHIEQNKLEELLKVAEILQIKGLTAKSSQVEEERSEIQPNASVKVETTPTPEPVVPKKQPVTLKAPTKLPPVIISAIDPLSLLQPAFVEESSETDKSMEMSQVRKVYTKKVKKRKLSEHEPSPPPVLYRKGTKSRPHVKVPRYYHNDYENLEDRKPTKKETPSPDPACTVDKIKTEPIDIEDTDVGYSQNFDKTVAVTITPTPSSREPNDKPVEDVSTVDIKEEKTDERKDSSSEPKDK